MVVSWTSIRDFVDDRLALLKELDEQENRYTKFNVEITFLDNRRLNYLAKALRMSKAELASRIVSCGLSDLERSLGLDATDVHSAYYKDVVLPAMVIPTEVQADE